MGEPLLIRNFHGHTNMLNGTWLHMGLLNIWRWRRKVEHVVQHKRIIKNAHLKKTMVIVNVWKCHTLALTFS